MTLTVTVKFFAIARDIVGNDERVMTVPAGSSTSTLLQAVVSEFPTMEKWMSHVRMAVNCEYVGPNHTLNDKDEVAIIPPVSGG